MGLEDEGREDLDALKSAVNLGDLIREHGVELRSAGQNLVGHCPFHRDRKASFSVNPQAPHGGLWNCFGCKKGGDVLRFLELKDNLSFPEAVAYLRQRLALLHGTPTPTNGTHTPTSGTTAHPNGTASSNGKPATDPDSPYALGTYNRPQLLGRVAAWYAKTLQQTRGAQHYLTRRGLGDANLWQAFDLGFADGTLLQSLPDSGELRDALVTLGVLTAKGREHFLGCVVVPLKNADGDVLGLYGRRIREDSEVKHLYLRHRQRGVLNPPAFKSGEPLYLAESVLDALSVWAAGRRNVSALYGAKKLPPDVDAMLTAATVREVRFCLDADAAGRAATEELAATMATRGITCATANLPEGQDPNSLLTTAGADALRTALDELTPLSVPPPLTDRPEPTEDGFILRMDGLVYRVAPRKPSSHGVQAFLKVMGAGGTVMDTVNLHAQRSRAALANQVVARMGVGKTDVERHLVAVLEAVEAWHESSRQEKPVETTVLETKRAPEMTEAERAMGAAFLARPDLVAAILEDMEALGSVGEEDNKLLAYLIGSSRKREKPLSGIVLSQSAAGKSALTELVELLTPPEDVVLYSRLTAQALVWMPKDYVKQKLLILEERVGGEAADYSIRTLQSKKRFVQAMTMKDPATGQMRTQEKEVEGPIAYLETTTNPHVNPENASRCFEICMDESEEQTRRIQEQQRRIRSFASLQLRRRQDAIRARHHAAQRLLEPVAVAIPYEHVLSFPTRWLRTRRDNERFLCLIEVVTFLHQYQRRRGILPADEFGPEMPYVMATVEDYRLAYRLARGVLGRTLHELTRHGQELWQEVRRMAAGLTGGKKRLTEMAFTRRQLRHFTGWPDHRLRDALAELVDMEYLLAVGSQGKTFEYQMLFDADTLPSPLSQLTTPEQLEALWTGEVPVFV